LVLGVKCDLGPEGSEGAIECPSWEEEDVDGVTKRYCCIDCEKIYEFDEKIPGSCCDDDDDRRRLNPAPINGNRFWPNGYVPYEIDSALPNQGRVTDAIAEWHSKTNIRLGRRSGEANYVRFVPGGGCSSYIGRIGGAQSITLASGCSKGNTIHEIGHALGMHHTQTREDRDSYININWANIPDSWKSNYNQVNAYYDDCLRYDYGSIMHYPATLGGKSVLTTTNPSGQSIGQRNGLSATDAGCMDGHYSPCRVALFQHDNFGGREYSPFGSEDYTLGELNSLEFENDQVSSMKIVAEPDTKCIVDLYQHGEYTGWHARFVADNSKGSNERTFPYSMAALRATDFVNDDMSSLKVNHYATCQVTLYQHGGYGGTPYGPYIAGDYTLSHLMTKGFRNDDVSSMRVTVLDREQCIVRLYQHGGYSGWVATFTVTNPNTYTRTFSYSLSTLQAAGFRNDDMSSMKISVNNAYVADSPGILGYFWNNNNNNNNDTADNNNYFYYLAYLIGVLVVVNLICYAVYIKRKGDKYKNTYQKVISMETDVESQQIL
jgi:hypothetical protein